MRNIICNHERDKYRTWVPMLAIAIARLEHWISSWTMFAHNNNYLQCCPSYAQRRLLNRMLMGGDQQQHPQQHVSDQNEPDLRLDQSWALRMRWSPLYTSPSFENEMITFHLPIISSSATPLPLSLSLVIIILIMIMIIILIMIMIIILIMTVIII